MHASADCKSDSAGASETAVDSLEQTASSRSLATACKMTEGLQNAVNACNTASGRCTDREQSTPSNPLHCSATVVYPLNAARSTAWSMPSSWLEAASQSPLSVCCAHDSTQCCVHRMQSNFWCDAAPARGPAPQQLASSAIPSPGAGWSGGTHGANAAAALPVRDPNVHACRHQRHVPCFIRMRLDKCSLISSAWCMRLACELFRKDLTWWYKSHETLQLDGLARSVQAV